MQHAASPRTEKKFLHVSAAGSGVRGVSDANDKANDKATEKTAEPRPKRRRMYRTADIAAQRTAKPWEKLPKESSKALAGFHAYLGLGPQRSLKAAAAKLGKSLKALELWSQKFGWIERALEYDEHLVKVEEEAKEVQLRAKAIDWVKRQEKLKEDEWELVQGVIAKLREFLAKPPPRISFRDAVYALDLASKVGRLATGMPTENTEKAVEIGPIIQIDIEAALERAYPSVVIEVGEEKRQIEPAHGDVRPPEKGNGLLGTAGPTQ